MGLTQKCKTQKLFIRFLSMMTFQRGSALGKLSYQKKFAIYFNRESRIPPFSGNLNYLHTTFLFVDGFYSNQA